MRDSTYQDFILKNIPRIITQIDRDEHSTTYGSCDRSHWHLKIRDFTSAILQQTGLALAILYNENFVGNIYYKNQNIKNWAEATVVYWSKIQLNDGSFNEYYPYEHGFPPTAFSLYSACEVYKRLFMNDNSLLDKFKKTAKYLISHIEEKAFNQEIASITALYSLYTIIKEKWILDGIEPKLCRILEFQSTEGWFPEYGGADLGYLSVALDMLTEYYVMSHDKRVEIPIHKVVGFIKYFVHPDLTVGGEYGSRNTTYFLPNGIEVASQLGNSDSAGIKKHLFSDTDQYNYFMDSVDDRYFSHYLMHSYLRALEKEQRCQLRTQIDKLPCNEFHDKYFPESGLISFNNGTYFAVASLKKGGVLKVYHQGKEIFIDCGYRVNYGKGCVAATNWLDQSYKITYENQNAKVDGMMSMVPLKVSTPILHIGLRYVAFLFGNRIITLLKKKMIFVDKHSDIYFSRKVEFGDQIITITDNLSSPQPVTIEKASNMSLRHVASGKFFMRSDLLSSSIVYKDVTNIKITTTFNSQNEQVDTSYTCSLTRKTE